MLSGSIASVKEGLEVHQPQILASKARQARRDQVDTGHRAGGQQMADLANSRKDQQ